MSRDDIQKLLGGYATGTLTPEEQQALFAAALDDQELFDALAREQSLRDLLRDPAAKAHLLTALDQKPAPWWASWWKPAGLATAMAAVALLAVTVIRNGPPEPKQATVAVANPPVAEPPSQARQAPQSSDLAMSTPKETESAPLRRKDKPAKPDLDAAEFKLRDERATAVAPTVAPPPAAPRAKAEADAVEVTSARETGAGARGGVVAGVAGVAPPPPPAAAPPPAPKVETTQSSANAVLEARTRVGARTLFLGGMQTSEMMKSSYAESKEQQAQLTQQAPAPQQRQIQGQRGNAQTLASQAFAAPPPQLGVRYSILTASGRPQLRIETNDEGYISVMARGESGTWRTLSSLTIARMTPHITIPLRPDEKELYVSFSRQVQIAKGGPYTPEPGADLSTNLTETDGGLTYVANPLPGAAGRELRFTIRLP